MCEKAVPFRGAEWKGLRPFVIYISYCGRSPKRITRSGKGTVFPHITAAEPPKVANLELLESFSEQAAESIVSAFGLQLSSFTQAAPSLPLPISLGGSQVVVKDSKGVERFAPLFYASPGQVNFQIPTGTAEGVATLTFINGVGTSQTGLVMIGKVAPALFSADSTGVGLAAGSALTVRADGSRMENNLARYEAATSKFIAQPIDMGGSGDQVYLTLYGTGIKNRNDLANVKIKIGGIDAPVLYAGAQGFFAGLDQINIQIPQGLSGKGEVIVEASMEGKTANQVRIVIR